MESFRDIKVCACASAGGHLTQLLKISSCWAGMNSFFISTSRIVEGSLEGQGKVYTVAECNRRSWWKTPLVFLKAASILLREKPHVVLSTGALPFAIVSLIGKLLGARVIWIESITNIDRLSLSGRFVRFFADLLVVQWPHLTEKYRKAKFLGIIE
jgi:UDP-N-acetylglucosamine:LPS N-acetylglucosamine transferase